MGTFAGAQQFETGCITRHTREVTFTVMTELADLIRGWLAAEPSRKVPDLERASGDDKATRVSKNTIYAILDRKTPKEPVRRKTLEGLARAMAPSDAAYRDAGSRIEQVETGPGVQAFVERLAEMSPVQLKAAIAAAEGAADALEDL